MIGLFSLWLVLGLLHDVTAELPELPQGCAGMNFTGPYQICHPGISPPCCGGTSQCCKGGCCEKPSVCLDYGTPQERCALPPSSTSAQSTPAVLCQPSGSSGHYNCPAGSTCNLADRNCVVTGGLNSTIFDPWGFSCDTSRQHLFGGCTPTDTSTTATATSTSGTTGAVLIATTNIPAASGTETQPNACSPQLLQGPTRFYFSCLLGIIHFWKFH